MQCQSVLFFASKERESAFRWGAKLGMSRALLSEAYEVTGMEVLAFRSWKGNNAIVLNRPLIHINCFIHALQSIFLRYILLI